MNFLCVTEPSVPDITMACLRAACEERDIGYFEIRPADFTFDDSDRAAPGDILYRPAIGFAAIRVEQFLYRPGVATFYADPGGVYFGPTAGPELFAAAGLPIPRTAFVLNGARPLLDAHVEAMGGYPVVLKVQGSSRGIGVMRVDSAASLYSVVDYALAQGATPLLSAFVADAVHWRVTVVGARAVAAYRNITEDNDFRTYGSDAAEDYTDSPDPDLAGLAVRAVATLRFEFGGVDILEHPSGRLYLLESNFPCFFAQPQTVAGIDVAGPMVDHLAAKAAKLAGNPA